VGGGRRRAPREAAQARRHDGCLPRRWPRLHDLPREHWARIASTNPLERVNREIKRRADVIGIFPNDDAIIRLVGALMLETNDEWAVARRYMSLESLARVTENPNVRLPAVAA
jgi:putative transposase